VSRFREGRFHPELSLGSLPASCSRALATAPHQEHQKHVNLVPGLTVWDRGSILSASLTLTKDRSVANIKVRLLYVRPAVSTSCQPQDRVLRPGDLTSLQRSPKIQERTRIGSDGDRGSKIRQRRPRGSLPFCNSPQAARMPDWQKRPWAAKLLKIRDRCAMLRDT
jgi:hypothetical protein